MTLALSLLVIGSAALGYAAWLVLRLRWPLESLPLFLAASAISTLFVAGLLGVLTPVAWLVVAGGLGSLAWQGRALLSAAREARWRCPPGLLAFLAASMWCTWRLHDAPFLGWDTFSHWGLVSSEVIREGALIGAGGPVLFKDYPPGTALFHLLFMLGAGFSEGGAHGAHALLACCALTALTTNRGAWFATATFVFGYVGVFGFTGLGLQALEVDHIVALLLGGALGGYYVSTDPGRVWRVVPVAFALPIVKSVGLLCALFLVVAVASDQLLHPAARRARRAAVVAGVLAPLIASGAWRVRVSALEARPTFSVDLSLTAATRPFSPERSTERDRVTVRRFVQALRTTVVGSEPGYWHPLARVRFATAQWALVFLVVTGVMYLRDRELDDRRRLIVSAACAAGFAVAFTAGLLHMYLHSFSEREGTQLASFERYMGIVVLALSCVALAWASLGVGRAGRAGALSKALVAAMTLLMTCLTSERAYAFAVLGPRPMDPVRVEVRRVVEPAREQLPLEARVFVLAPGSRGHELHIARYELAPRVVNRSSWSVGAPRFAGDSFTVPLTPEELGEVLAGWTHVLLLSPDEAFWSEYGALFGGRRGALFRVDSRQGRIELVPA